MLFPIIVGAQPSVTPCNLGNTAMYHHDEKYIVERLRYFCVLRVIDPKGIFTVSLPWSICRNESIDWKNAVTVNA